jgi:general stress protein 26
MMIKSKVSKDKKRILRIMKKTCSHAYLATVAGKQPWVRSVSPIVGNDMSIWISTFEKARKVSQIKRNPKVCLHFARQPDGGMVATVHGRAKIVKSIRDKEQVWEMAQFDLKQFFPGGPRSNNFCLLKIIPREIEWWDSWGSGRKTTRLA